MIDVSCILINYNTCEYTLGCIHSILQNTISTVSFEIIVIDNASNPADYQHLESEIAKLNTDTISLVRSRINTGFGGGNMIGVQYAQNCRYYAFINNDTLFDSADTLRELISFMENHPHIGVCSPQMLDSDRCFKKTLDHFSSPMREIVKRDIMEFFWPKKYPKRNKTYNQPLKVNYIQGAFMFVDAKCFNLIGGFDTNLFLYYEEADLCKRLLKEQKKDTFLVPYLQYIHFQSKSSNKNMQLKMEQKISLFYYIRKHFSWFGYKVLQAYFSIRYFLSSLVKPKYWPLFLLFITGVPLSKSLKQKQQILPPLRKNSDLIGK